MSSSHDKTAIVRIIQPTQFAAAFSNTSMLLQFLHLISTSSSISLSLYSDPHPCTVCLLQNSSSSKSTQYINDVRLLKYSFFLFLVFYCRHFMIHIVMLLSFSCAMFVTVY